MKSKEPGLRIVKGMNMQQALTKSFYKYSHQKNGQQQATEHSPILFVCGYI